MSFYCQQVQALKENYNIKDHLVEQVVQAKKFIDCNFADRISLKQMAEEACCSKFHFLRLFKTLYGRTPHQYLTDVRISHAKQLLRSGLPVADACILTGFESTSSFKALFKKCTGFTPASYQKNLGNMETISETRYRFLPFFYSFQKSNFQYSK